MRMKKVLAAALLCALCLLAAVPALAADVFAYAEKSIQLFEDETAAPDILREGKFAEDGEISYVSENKRVVTVDENGVITPAAPGKTRVKATLKQNGRAVKSTAIQVQVSRRVTAVALNTKNLTVYEPDDEFILPLLQPREEDEEPLQDRVILIAVGKAVRLSAACTPDNATNRKVTYATTDEEVARIQNGGTELKGVAAGECGLMISSVQNPEVQEFFHVLVIQPVRKITIEAPFKTMAAGTSMQLDAVCSPENAGIQSVAWSSRNPKIAEVDASGLVYGLAKGRVVIDAKAADGSGVVGSITLTVSQDVTEIAFKQTEATVSVGRSVQLNVTVLPKNADNRQVTWSSSDESIATVRNGQVTGRKAGECLIICTSKSNPEVSSAIPVTVVQPVTKIVFLNEPGIRIPVNTTYQLDWSVLPDDATVTDVVFSSNAKRVATVDENGLVTGLSRGTATITATATDGSRKTGTYKITVIQPVEGVTLPQEVYYVQRNIQFENVRSTEITATILPSNANNQKVYWESGDPYVAAVTAGEANKGYITGGYLRQGSTTVTATTEDGGFVATADLILDDFDRSVSVEGAWVIDNNRMQLSLRNVSGYLLRKIRFRISCFDTMGNPMTCNQDHICAFFDGSYPYDLLPDGWASNGFNMDNYLETGTIGYFTVAITGFEFENGQVWEIPEEYRLQYQSVPSGYMGQPTPAPATETPAPDPDNYWVTQAPEEGDTGNG